MEYDKSSRKKNTYPLFSDYVRLQVHSLRHFKTDQFLMYLAGVAIFSLGAKLFIVSQLGTDPLDVLIISIDQLVKLGMGACSALVSLFFLTWWML